MSSSILTNQSALTALLSLNQTQSTLNQYENQISTGLAISSAADNASYWSIATSMTSNVGALGAVSSALSESSSMLSTTTAALQATVSVMDAIKNDLTSAAANPNANMTAIQTDITAQQQLLLSIGQSASFNGLNLLTDSSTTPAGVTTTLGTANFAASYNSTGGTQAISYISVVTTYSSATQVGTELFAAASTSAATATGGILGTAGANSSVSVLAM